jgi:hypothetical protein
LWHLQVQQDEVRMEFSQRFEGCDTVSCFQKVVLVATKRSHDGLADQRFVFDKQQRADIRHRCSSLFAICRILPMSLTPILPRFAVSYTG